MTNEVQQTAAAVQHTPGPWRAIERPGETIRVDIVTDAPELPFTPAFVAGDILPPDARLIAAAPALLEALEALEWSAEVDVAAGGYTAGCPSCGGQRDDLNDGYGSGHEDYCTLARALRAARGEA